MAQTPLIPPTLSNVLLHGTEGEREEGLRMLQQYIRGLTQPTKTTVKHLHRPLQEVDNEHIPSVNLSINFCGHDGSSPWRSTAVYVNRCTGEEETVTLNLTVFASGTRAGPMKSNKNSAQKAWDNDIDRFIESGPMVDSENDIQLIDLLNDYSLGEDTKLLNEKVDYWRSNPLCRPSPPATPTPTHQRLQGKMRQPSNAPMQPPLHVPLRSVDFGTLERSPPHEPIEPPRPHLMGRRRSRSQPGSFTPQETSLAIEPLRGPLMPRDPFATLGNGGSNPRSRVLASLNTTSLSLISPSSAAAGESPPSGRGRPVVFPALPLSSGSFKGKLSSRPTSPEEPPPPPPNPEERKEKKVKKIKKKEEPEMGGFKFGDPPPVEPAVELSPRQKSLSFGRIRPPSPLRQSLGRDSPMLRGETPPIIGSFKFPVEK